MDAKKIIITAAAAALGGGLAAALVVSNNTRKAKSLKRRARSAMTELEHALCCAGKALR